MKQTEPYDVMSSEGKSASEREHGRTGEWANGRISHSPTLPLALSLIVLVCLTSCRQQSKPVIFPFQAQLPYVEKYYVKTEDNWEIALHRFQPESLDANRVPVILCHGLGYSGRFWYLAPENDFASYLRDAGYDTWVIDLRGSGDSARPAWDLVRVPEIDPARLARTKMGRQDWCADEYIRYDAPAAIDLVRRETGHDKVAWVGHSLGGMILLGYLEQFGDEKVRCFAAVASPMIIPHPPNNILRDIPGFKLLMQMVNNRWQAFAGIVTLSQLKSPIDTLFYNADNVELPMIMSLFLNATEDIPSGMIDQTLSLAKTGEFVSLDGKVNYTAELPRIRLPILLLAGKVDNMADCEGVREVYRRISSKDKTFHLYGLANGDSIDYGHDDLIIGKNAKEEVFPFILNWLDKRTRIASESSRK